MMFRHGLQISEAVSLVWDDIIFGKTARCTSIGRRAAIAVRTTSMAMKSECFDHFGVKTADHDSFSAAKEGADGGSNRSAHHHVSR
jgi:hypothetical protein